MPITPLPTEGGTVTPLPTHRTPVTELKEFDFGTSLDVPQIAPQMEKVTSGLRNRAASRILDESESWREWLSAENWLRACVYSSANLWIGYTENVSAPLVSTFMDQCGASASGVSTIFVAASISYLLAAFGSSAFQKKCENGNIQLGVGMIVSSLPLYFMKLPNSIWLLSSLWFVQGIGRGICEPNIAAFAFQMTIDDSGDSDPVFGALLMQCFMCFYGIGAVLAPLSVQTSEALTNSYAPALFVFASFGIIVAIVMLFTKSPPVKAADTTTDSEANEGTKEITIEHSISTFGRMAREVHAVVRPVTLEVIEEVPAAERQKTRWHTAVTLMACCIIYFDGAFQVPMNSFIGDYTAEHLHMNASVGRYLNTVYFASQMSSRMLWMYPMRLFSTTYCLALTQIGYIFAGALIFTHALATSNGAHSWMLYLTFAIAGIVTSPILSLSLRFIDSVMGSEPIWGAVTLTMFILGTSTGSFLSGVCIDKFGRYSLPYYLLADAVCGCVLFLAIVTIDRMFVRVPSPPPLLDQMRSHSPTPAEDDDDDDRHL